MCDSKSITRSGTLVGEIYVLLGVIACGTSITLLLSARHADAGHDQPSDNSWPPAIDNLFIDDLVQTPYPDSIDRSTQSLFLYCTKR
jgi:hypothetical protein